MSQICPQTLSTATSSTSSLPPSSLNILSTSITTAITKIFIYIDSNRDDANEPFSIKINKPSTSITLDDFLVAIPRPYTKNYKYFFKSVDPVLGVIREEITDLKQILPSANGRIAAWLMPAVLTQNTTNDITTTTANTSYTHRTRQQDDSLFTTDSSASEMTDIASQIDHDDDDRSTLSSSSSNSPHTTSGVKKYRYDLNLTRNSDMETICQAMQQTHSGLEIRDRLWLKIMLKNSFLGSDLVHWLYKHVDGFIDKQDAKDYACALLERGYIRHPIVGLLTRGFSKSCYYVFGRSNDDDDDDDGHSQINEMSQLTIGESTIHYDAITRPTYGFVDKNNIPVLYASTSSLTSSFKKKPHNQSSGESGGIRMTPLSFLANNNATFSTIRSHNRPNNNSTCTTDNSIITI
ncbi:unnamed protein product [Rotaria magnacalcarata]|uniref:DEP domain-containing protein n=1 Tax=Rotaria magnacalcarata TaxID=392030 RepID=A0A8S2K7H6_9BILA|nr:unnamed protein product [Rotaria magnacalcarata]